MQRFSGAVVALVIVCSGLALTPAAAGTPPYCRAQGTLHAADLPAQVPLSDCDIVGRTITAGGVSMTVPPPGRGTTIAAMSKPGTGEGLLSVRTTTDGVVEIAAATGEVSADSVPPNDRREDAAAQVGYDWTASGTTEGASIDETEAVYDTAVNDACVVAAENQPDQSVWYRFTAPAFAELVIAVPSAVRYDVVDEYGSAQSCNGDPGLGGTTFPVSKGSVYFVRIGTVGAPAAFSVSVHPPRPSNDSFGSAYTLIVNGFHDNTKIQGATQQVSAGEPVAKVSSCGPGTRGTVWYKLKVGTLHRVDVNVDAGFAVHKGSALGSLTRLACGSSDKRVILPLTGPFYVQGWAPIDRDRLQVALYSAEPYPNAPPPCASAPYTLLAQPRRTRMSWRFYPGALPSGWTADQALATIKLGISAIPAARNDCGVADAVSATAPYAGTTTKRATMCTASKPDGVNTVDFGPAVVPGSVGLACTAQAQVNGVWRVTETDIRFTKSEPFAKAPDSPTCPYGYDLAGVAAHEAGHAFGLDHSSGQNQTMYAYSAHCNAGFRSLGKGDVAGLTKLY